MTMHGTMLVVAPSGEIERTDFTSAPDLEEIKAAIGGGWLEKVPGFSTLAVNKEARTCVALCDEDGKRKAMPTNHLATQLWQVALISQGHPGLLDRRGHVTDYLVGPVVVLYGDAAFMESL